MNFRKIFVIVVVIVLLLLIAGLWINTDKNKDKMPYTEAVLDAIANRTSVRDFLPNKSISDDTIHTILRAGMAAPTAMNSQPWAFVVVDDKALLKQLADSLPYAKMTAKASLAIVVCGDSTKMIEGKASDFWIQDVSAATENMLLAIHALDLGAVWTGVYPDLERCESVKKALKLPSNLIPLNVIPVGFPVKEQKAKDKWKQENIYYNNTGKKRVVKCD